MPRPTHLAAAAALACAASSASAQPIANSTTDYSGVQGSHGWYYGYWDRTGDASGVYDPSKFTLMPAFAGGVWSVAPGTYWTSLSADGAHPNGTTTSLGRLPHEQWAIRRYVPTADAVLTVEGTFGKEPYGMGGDGTTALILVGGTPSYASTVGGTAAPGAFAASLGLVTAGTPIDFVLTPGPNDDDHDDSSELTAMLSASVSVTNTPEPGAVALLVLGLPAAALLRRRAGAPQAPR